MSEILLDQDWCVDHYTYFNKDEGCSTCKYEEEESKMKDLSQESISWGKLAELTHATQVERFGWCICEGTNGEGQLAEDCPKEESK